MFFLIYQSPVMSFSRLVQISSPQRRVFMTKRTLFSATANQDEGPRRIRVITCDVTGTLVSFLGRIEEHYGNAAQICGVDFPSDKMSSIGPCFSQAYRETSSTHPCFGGSEISAKEWWRRCVLRSFELVGTPLQSHQKDAVFQRVYSKFGSHDAYGAFPGDV